MNVFVLAFKDRYVCLFFNEIKCVSHIHVNESLYNKHKWCKTIAGARVQPSGRHLVRGSGSLLSATEGKKNAGKK